MVFSLDTYMTFVTFSKLLSRICTLSEEEVDPWLYDPTMDMQGEGFVRPNSTPRGEVIIPLDSKDINNLCKYHVIPSIPTLPSTVRRIWIYNICEEIIDLVVCVDKDCRPLHIRQLLDPLPLTRLQRFYDVSPP